MFAKSNLASVVSMVLAVSALGISINNTLQLRDLPTGADVDSKVETLRTEITTHLNERTDRFESDVEVALEAIVERRRAAAVEAKKKAQAEARAAVPANLSADGMLSMNKDGQVVYGNPDAAVTIFTFEDFRCGFCERYHPTMQQYVNNSDGQVNWIYKPYPILGPASQQLAVAGECVAQIEGPEAFWRYSEQAYATKNWATAVKYSELQNLDKINECVQENTYAERIDQSMAEGRELNVTGTPASIFRNNSTEKGALIPGFLQPDQIEQMVQQIKAEGVSND